MFIFNNLDNCENLLFIKQNITFGDSIKTDDFSYYEYYKLWAFVCVIILIKIKVYLVESTYY